MKKIHIFFSLLLILSMAMSSTIPFTKDNHVAQAATSIYINDQTFTLEVDHYRTLRVHGTTQRASFRSSNSAVASVSSTGKVFANAPGTATISISVAGKKMNCKVSVIRINKKAFSLTPGKTSTLTITGTKSNVTWASSNESIATVSSNGKVTAIAPGTASITASVDGKILTSKLSVIAINYKAITLELGGKSGFIKTLKINDTIKPITWTSSNKLIATVASNGRVSAKSPGSATITAFVDGIKFTTKVKVLQLNTKEFTLNKSETKKLEVKGTTSEITWSSNNLNIVTVSNDGTVTPIASGTATITGYVDGRNMYSKVTVVE